MDIKRYTRQIKRAVRKKERPNKRIPRKDLLSTGSTLLNLICSNNPYGGFLKGKYYLIVGDSISGKTFLSMTCFAEAKINKFFKDHRLIYDNVEDGMLMDVERLFGKAVADSIEPPAVDEDGNPIFSYTIEEFYFNLDDIIHEGKPFIYVLDSMDGLTSESEIAKFDQHKDAYRKGKDAAGSYGDGKAKKSAEGLRKVLRGLRDTGSILIIICQTRDNIGVRFGGKTRSGGHALKFYSTVEIWSRVKNAIRKRVKDKDREIGVHIELKVKKNRITGSCGEAEIDIYPEYGLDDIGTCIDFLVAEKWWGKKKQSIIAKEFDIRVTRVKLIKHIEENDLLKELQAIVGRCWKDLKKASSLGRERKYD